MCLHTMIVFKKCFSAAKNLMHNDSVLMVEVAYAVDTIGQGLFDTIYHEHVCSYSLYSLKKNIRNGLV